MSSSSGAGNATPAARYFVFILCVCVLLFGFLMTRLVTTIQNDPEFNQPVVPVNEIHVASSHLVKPVQDEALVGLQRL